ncbi:hypothetical protein BDFB_002951 [Asbolus verrucosus]|uniref:Uncharacterized protein n=1 Tax=Asbolus verrucosus TaxID=1661398 RepID=A0A482W6U5_ASBVE|nr:hypothetical protein BDFB_002951 [Asbolus verrucosus]
MYGQFPCSYIKDHLLSQLGCRKNAYKNCSPGKAYDSVGKHV